MQVVELILFIIWAGFFTYWLISAWKNQSPFKRRQSRGSLLSYMAISIVIWVLCVWLFYPVLMFECLIPDTAFFILTGLLITCAGLGFAVLARVHLGKFWSGQPSIRVDHKIIRTGPYRIVRHPISPECLLV